MRSTARGWVSEPLNGESHGCQCVLRSRGKSNKCYFGVESTLLSFGKMKIFNLNSDPLWVFARRRRGEAHRQQRIWSRFWKAVTCICRHGPQINIGRAISCFIKCALTKNILSITWSTLAEIKQEWGCLCGGEGASCYSPLEVISQEGRPPEWVVSRCKGEARSRGFRPALCFKGDTKEERATKNLMKWLMPWHAPTVAAGELPEAANMSTPHFPVQPLLKC